VKPPSRRGSLNISPVEMNSLLLAGWPAGGVSRHEALGRGAQEGSKPAGSCCARVAGDTANALQHHQGGPIGRAGLSTTRLECTLTDWCSGVHDALLPENIGINLLFACRPQALSQYAVLSRPA
jgi:hypothetical protein